MITTILFFIFVAIATADFIRALLWQRSVKKTKIRADFMHAEQLEALAKVEAAFKNSTIDVVDRNSIKRHIATLLNRLDEIEQKFDEALEQNQTIKKPLDLDAMIDEIKNQPLIAFKDNNNE